MAIADLAKFGESGVVALTAISERQHLSLAYLEKLFAKLRTAGLVESTRGRGGGYRLARAPEDIAIADILVAVDEPTRMTRCVGAKGCVAENRCLTHGLWSALGQNIEAFLARVTVSDVINDRLPDIEGEDAARRTNGRAITSPSEHAP
jgi:Rrf2 family iron-sulfur cluster assembly transcriptional regulator